MYPYYVLAVLSVFLFLHGFFPMTKPIYGSNFEPPTRINNISFQPQIYHSDITKAVIIVIDALRLDFVNPKYMPLTSRISNEAGCVNTVLVETPTVTLPRIKALTSGNVPQFIDLVLNLASTEILEDSLIHSMIKNKKRVVFYGDNTWLKLFPKFFVRHEGTNSFFVNDFKEVDDNVTRNVFAELKRQDWDVMILHYLGLDHIGHVYGPFSNYIPNKLKEMDQIIYHIYSKLTENKEKYLLLVTGDHGMRDSGGHGGSSYFETHVPLIMVGLPCNNGSLLQVDIPLNLAVLLGLNIPSTCIGQIKENLLHITLDKYLFALRYNNLLLQSRANMCEQYFLRATKFHELYIKTSDERYATAAVNIYKNCSKIISEHLIKSSINQNFYSLTHSIIVSINVLILIMKSLMPSNDNTLFRTVEYVITLIIVLINFLLVNLTVTVIILVAVLVNNMTQISINMFHISENILKLLTPIIILQPFTFVSSSFVEEEHQYWYFFTSFLIIISFIRVLSATKQLYRGLIWIFYLCTFRFLRTINSTGDKWANYPDFSDWLLKADNYIYHQLFFILGLCLTFYTILLLYKNKNNLNILLIFTILICIYLLKSINYQNIVLGRLIWFLILCNITIFYNYPKLINWILISTLLLKPYNVILIPYCILISISFSKVYNNTTAITIFHFLLSKALYFTQGHSNSLGSVDISIGYIGLNEYVPLLVIFQVLCHIYSFPVLCHFLVFQYEHMDHKKFWKICFSCHLYITVITCVITIIFRHHLFIWSVFAPKLFIECINLFFLFIEFNIYLCFKVCTSLSKLSNRVNYFQRSKL